MFALAARHLIFMLSSCYAHFLPAAYIRTSPPFNSFRFGVDCFCGGKSVNPEREEWVHLLKRSSVVVLTPAILQNLIERGAACFEDITLLVSALARNAWSEPRLLPPVAWSCLKLICCRCWTNATTPWVARLWRSCSSATQSGWRSSLRLQCPHKLLASRHHQQAKRPWCTLASAYHHFWGPTCHAGHSLVAFLSSSFTTASACLFCAGAHHERAGPAAEPSEGAVLGGA